jgi:hypothetical protein
MLATAFVILKSQRDDDHEMDCGTSSNTCFNRVADVQRVLCTLPSGLGTGSCGSRRSARSVLQFSGARVRRRAERFDELQSIVAC